MVFSFSRTGTLTPIVDTYRLSTDPDLYNIMPANKINNDVYVANYLDSSFSLENGHFASQMAAIASAPPNTTASQQSVPMVVVKRTNLESLSEINYQNLIKEVTLAQWCRHPNLLPFLASFVVRNELWTVTPVAQYGSCYELAKPSGMPEICIAIIVRDVLKALTYLHKNLIIHHGVRSSRVMVTGSGKCMLTGFKYSMSMVKDGRPQNLLYAYPNNAKTNLKWLAPEVLEQNLFGYDHKADIYSLGVMCCELANGCPPFEDMQPTEMLLDKLSGNFPKPMDRTCKELDQLNFEEFGELDLQKYLAYKEKLFSKSFHRFTVGKCLQCDVSLRPDAERLLKHKFLKQIRTKDNLVELLNVKDSIFKRFNKRASTSSTSRTTPEPSQDGCFCHRRPCQCYPSRPSSVLTRSSKVYETDDDEWNF